MPPKNKDTGAFSLKLTSSEDTVLEIGSSKHLRFCSAIKSDGKQCTQWVDGRKTEVCEFHMALKVDKARKGRMEFNTMVGGGPRGSGRGGRGAFRGGRGGSGRGGGFRDDGLVPEGRTYNRELHELMYIAPKELGFSATRLLDDQDADVNAWQRGMSREEMQRKRQKAVAKEKELGRKLSELGSSAGSEYLRPRTDGRKGPGAVPSLSEAPLPEPPDARSLGLLGKKAEDVVLASKRKRGPNSGSAPMGWGGASKRGLLLARAQSPLKSAQKDPEQPSPKKKARFMLADKGLREPGRESLGNVITLDDDSEDDLEIVK
jgi:minichromosome maintenance protein 10